MKSYEEFTVNISDLDASGLQKVLTKEIIKALEPKLVGLQLLEPDTMLVGTGGKTRTFRKRTAASDAQVFSEGADIPGVTTEVTYSYVDATPENIGHSETITGDAIAAADFNIIDDTKEALVDGMARKIDERIWDKILDKTSVTNESVGTGDGTTQWFDLANDNIIKMGTVTVAGTAKTIGPDFKVDYYRGAIFFETAPGTGEAIVASYDYSTRNKIEVATVNQLAYEDVIDARRVVVSNYETPDTLVVHENEAADLLKEDDFIDASKYGSREVILNGELGKFGGLKVLVSQKMYEGIAVILKRGSILGYYVYKEKLQSKVERLQKKANDVFMAIWERSIPCIVNGDMVCLTQNSQLYAKKKP